MIDFFTFATYIWENLLYYLFILVVLIAWDSIDFYLEIHNFIFFRSRIFGFYFIIRAFFSVVLMEITLFTGLANVDNKIILSFLTPLMISVLLQNLVVNIGGSARIDVSNLFDEFRSRILFDIQDREIRKNEKKILRFEKRLYDSKIPTEKIASACMHLGGDRPEFEEFKAKIEKFSPARQRMEYVKFLLRRAGIESARIFFGEIGQDDETNSNQ